MGDDMSERIYRVSVNGLLETYADKVTRTTVTLYGVRSNKDNVIAQVFWITDLEEAHRKACHINATRLIKARQTLRQAEQVKGELKEWARTIREEKQYD